MLYRRLLAAISAALLWGLPSSAAFAAAAPGAPSGPAAGGSQAGAVVRAEDFFRPEEIERARRYRRGKLLFFLGALGLEAAYWVFAAAFLARRIERLGWELGGGRFVLAGLIVFTALLLLRRAALYPIALFSGYFHEHAYGLSKQTLAAWHLDFFKAVALELAVGVPALLLLFALLRRDPRTWWLPMSAVAALFIVLAAAVWPLWIAPLFDRTRPLEPGPLRTRILELARRAGVPLSEVYVAEAGRRSRHANAYFAGLGPTRRIVLYDTLLESQSEAEILSVVAHELGHWRRGHTWKGVALSVAGAAAALFLADRWLGFWCSRGWFGIEAKSALRACAPLLFFFFVLETAALPLRNAVSRAFEREADREELALTGDPDAMVSSLVKLARRNLSDPDPPRLIGMLFGTHPSILERIRFALSEVRR